MNQAVRAPKKKFHFPHLGMRIVKTGISVFFCLLLHYLFSTEVALISSLAAIVSMQSTLESTLKTGVGRFAGTALGGLAGMAMLPMAEAVEIEWLYLIMMPLGMIFAMYVCLCFHIPGSVSICAFVYITVLIVPFNPNNTGNPYFLAVIRILDTAAGVAIALLVNRFIAPPRPAPVTSVRVPVDTFATIYSHVSDRLSGNEELVLLNSALINPALKLRRPGDIMSEGFPKTERPYGTVSIPVPTEFKKNAYVNTVYIGQDYSVIPLDLRQRNGYVDIPAEMYPVTVAWHVQQSETHETYGLLHRHRRGERSLQLAANHPVAALHRRKTGLFVRTDKQQRR